MAFEAGHRMGPYEIRRRIGAGGMGEVYSAFDTRLQRSVAIKVIRDRNTSDASRARLEREARAVAALSHPNVMSIFDIGADGDSIYVVSELLEGMTLREALRHGRLPTATAIDYTRQAAAGLASAHAKGFVHRDIKPENLFVTEDGRLKVLDFGVARTADNADAITAVRDERLTAPDAVVGTIGYMSPEQLRAGSIDGRSDIFSLGCVLFEMLRGSRPFAHPTQTATIAAILADDPDFESISSAPPFVIAALKRCLAKEPQQRFASANELIAALDRPRLSWSRARVALATVAAMLVIVAIAGVRNFFTTSPPVQLQTKPHAVLAVLPFENISADPAQEYFSDGLTEETITEFGRLNPSQLSVIARSSTMRYKNVRADVRTIARELGADYLIEGSVRRGDDRIRVSAQLVRGTDGAEIWADSYDRTVDDVLALQAELARGVAAAVQIKVRPDRLAPKTDTLPTLPASREAFLRGRYYLHLGTAQNRRNAVDSMHQAVTLEPTSAVAHAGLASALLSESTLDYPPRDIIEEARASVHKALQIDDGIAEAHEALGEILLEYDWKWDDAERELRRALAIDPNLAIGHLDYASLLITAGRTAQGLDELRRGRELDPVSASTNRDGLFNLFCTRRYDDAYEQSRHAIQLEPRNDFAYSIMGIVELSRGQTAAAAAAADRVLQLKGTQTARSIAAYVYANVGRANDARTVLHDIEAESKQKFACFFNVAVLYDALGERDHAFAALDRAYDDRTG